MLMLFVLVLADAKLPLKFYWTGACVLLITAHWTTAALPQPLHCDTYMDSLGKIIVDTKGVDWLRLTKAVPFKVEWLARAGRAANRCGYLSGIVDGCFW